jgi:hypothetical protein
MLSPIYLTALHSQVFLSASAFIAFSKHVLRKHQLQLRYQRQRHSNLSLRYQQN